MIETVVYLKVTIADASAVETGEVVGRVAYDLERIWPTTTVEPINHTNPRA